MKELLYQEPVTTEDEVVALVRYSMENVLDIMLLQIVLLAIPLRVNECLDMLDRYFQYFPRKHMQ